GERCQSAAVSWSVDTTRGAASQTGRSVGQTRLWRSQALGQLAPDHAAQTGRVEAAGSFVGSPRVRAPTVWLAAPRAASTTVRLGPPEQGGRCDRRLLPTSPCERFWTNRVERPAV